VKRQPMRFLRPMRSAGVRETGPSPRGSVNPREVQPMGPVQRARGHVVLWRTAPGPPRGDPGMSPQLSAAPTALTYNA
jgi:hypothetical protein